MKPFQTVRLLVGLVVALALSPAHATLYYWTNTAGGIYSTVGNWATNAVPTTITDDAYFSSNATYAVTFTSSALASNAVFNASRGGNVTLDLGGFTWTLTNGFNVSNAGTNTVLVTNGTVRSLGTGANVGVYIGNASGAVGTLILADGGRLVTTNNANTCLVIGNGGGGSRGTLTVSNGGAFTALNVRIGEASSSSGFMNIYDGTNMVTANANGAMLIGNQGGGTGTVLIAGNSALLTVTNGGSAGIRLGNSGTGFITISNGGTLLVGGGGILLGYGTGVGTLVVTNGGRLFSSSVTVGNGNGTAWSTNDLVVVGGGSLWTNSGSVGIGSIGVNATVLVTDPGSTFTNGGAITLGAGANSTGNRFLVSNAASVVIGGILTLGNVAGAQGTMIVSSSGRVNGAAVTLSANATSSNNSLVVNGPGSSMTIGALTVGSLGNFNSLIITNGGTVYSGAAKIGNNNAALNNSAVLNGGTWTNAGLSMLGSSNSLTILAGSLFQSAGSTYLGSSAAGVTGISSNQSVTVTGQGAVWTNLGTINIGQYSSYAAQVLVNNGGLLYSAGGIAIGGAATNSSNRLVISDQGSTGSMAGVRLDVGGGTTGDANLLAVSNGAALNAFSVAVGSGLLNTNNLFLVTGPGSVARLSLGLSIGTNSGAWGIGGTVLKGDGSARVANGGLLELNVLWTGYSPGSTFSNIGGVLQFATNTPDVFTRVAGAIVVNNGWISFSGITNADVMGSQGSNALKNIVFTGTNTFRLNNASNTFAASPQNYTFGYSSANPSNYAGLEMINNGTAWKSAWLAISNNGSMLVSNTSASILGVLTNSGTITVASASATYASNVVLSAGSYTAYAGSNTFSSGLGIRSGATFGMDALSTLSAGAGGVTNLGTLRFFADNDPSARLQAATTVVVSNGVVEFRGADSFLTNVFGKMSFFGNNTLSMDGSTNASLPAFTVGTGQNFSVLQLGGAAPLWQGSALLIDSGGTLRASNTLATIGAVLTNAGTVSVINGRITYLDNVVLSGGTFLTQGGTNNFTRGLGMASGATLTFTSGTSRVDGVISNSGTINTVNANVTFGGPVVISGGYISDPSTNTFTTNVTVTAGGYLVGGLVVSNADQFVFEKDLLMFSTNKQFSLSSAAVLFTNSANHLLSISNSGAMNIGQGYSSFSQVASNFAIGTLSIGLSNKLTIAGNKDSLTNALYVGWLDIRGLGSPGMLTNTLGDVTNTLLLALNLPNVNLYYDVYDSRNNWLTAQLSPVAGAGYDLWGGGLLLPIPEPSPLLAVGAGLALLAFLRRRRA